jgi:hypothetical protein
MSANEKILPIEKINNLVTLFYVISHGQKFCSSLKKKFCYLTSEHSDLDRECLMLHFLKTAREIKVEKYKNMLLSHDQIDSDLILLEYEKKLIAQDDISCKFYLSIQKYKKVIVKRPIGRPVKFAGRPVKVKRIPLDLIPFFEYVLDKYSALLSDSNVDDNELHVILCDLRMWFENYFNRRNS